MSFLERTVQVVAPATGATVTANAGSDLTLIVNPAAAIASLTIAFNATPRDGDRVTITSTKAVTLLTMSTTVGVMLNALTTLALGGFGTWQYVKVLNNWIRIA